MELAKNQSNAGCDARSSVSLFEIDGHGEVKKKEVLAMDNYTPNSSAVFVFAHVPPYAHALSDIVSCTRLL